jgi:hypothetical protein
MLVPERHDVEPELQGRSSAYRMDLTADSVANIQLAIDQLRGMNRLGREVTPTARVFDSCRGRERGPPLVRRAKETGGFRPTPEDTKKSTSGHRRWPLV